MSRTIVVAALFFAACAGDLPKVSADLQLADGLCNGSIGVPVGYPTIGSGGCGGHIVFSTTGTQKYDWTSVYGAQPQGDGFYDWRVKEPPLRPGEPPSAIGAIEIDFPRLDPGTYSARDCALVQLAVSSGLDHRTGEGEGAYAGRSLELVIEGKTDEAIWGKVKATACASFGQHQTDAGTTYDISCETISEGIFALAIEPQRRDSSGCIGSTCCTAAKDCPESILPPPAQDDPFQGRCLRLACFDAGCRVRDQR